MNSERPINPSIVCMCCAIAMVFACFCGTKRDGKKAQHGAAGRDTVACMFYNVENLFDFVDDGAEYPEFKPGSCNWTAETFNRKLYNIARAIAAANADIVALCEIENVHTLQQLQIALRKKGARYRYRAIADTPHPTMTCPAVLSRLPIAQSRSHGIPKTGQYYTRNILETDIAFNGHILKLFVNHWPSKRNPESHRIAAARIVRARLEQLPHGIDYILAGDFNSNLDDCEEIARSKLNDTEGATGLHHILGTVESLPGEPADYIDEKELISSSSGMHHYDLWHELLPYERMSYMYRTKPETPDHMLLPRSLYDKKGICYTDNSFSVFRFNGRLLFGGKPYRWRVRYTKAGKMHLGEGYSDHLPLLLRLHICNSSGSERIMPIE